MWSLKKFVTCIRALLISFYCASATLFQCYSITSPVLFTKNNKLWNERKGNFLNMWNLRYIKGGRKLQLYAQSHFLTHIHV